MLAGAVTFVLLDESVAIVPPVGAALSRIRLHIADVPDIRLVGVQLRADTCGNASATVRAIAAPLDGRVVAVDDAAATDVS
jgi:hypothetical protein